MSMESEALMQAYIDDFCEENKDRYVGKKVTIYEEAPQPKRQVVRPKSNSLFDRAVARGKQFVEDVKFIVVKARPQKKVKVTRTLTMNDLKKKARQRFASMNDTSRFDFAERLYQKGKSMHVAVDYAKHISEKAKSQGALSDRLQERADEMIRKETERELAIRAFQNGYGVDAVASEKQTVADITKNKKQVVREVDYSELKGKEQSKENDGYAGGRRMEVEPIKASDPE